MALTLKKLKATMSICIIRRKGFKASRRTSSDREVRAALIAAQRGICPGIVDAYGEPVRECDSRVLVTCDHIQELQYGGRDCIENLQMLCKVCDKLKTRRNQRLRRDKKPQELF